VATTPIRRRAQVRTLFNYYPDMCEALAAKLLD